MSKNTLEIPLPLLDRMLKMFLYMRQHIDPGVADPDPDLMEDLDRVMSSQDRSG
jgi:hypothetical protein